MKQMMGAGTMLTSIKTNTSADGEMILVPRRSTDNIRRIRLPKPVYVVHFVNAFEQDDGTLIIDACIFHDFPFGEEFGYTGKHTPFDPLLPDQREAQRMYRITIPPDSDEGTWEMLSPYGIDFPRVPGTECGQNARYMVGATRSDAIHSDPFDSIIVVDLHDPEHPAQMWSTSDTVFVGEPIVAANPTGEDHILVLLSDALQNRHNVHIFRPSNVSKMLHLHCTHAFTSDCLSWTVGSNRNHRFSVRQVKSQNNSVQHRNHRQCKVLTLSSVPCGIS